MPCHGLVLMQDENVAALQILLVEDNPIDVRVALKALNALSTVHEVVVANDGDQAIANMSPTTSHRPDLVLLDLNLPGRDGLDVLDHMQRDSALRRLPVLVLTTSSNAADVTGAYDRGANAYVNKPIDLEGWNDLAARIEAFWFSVVRLPST